MPSQTQSESLPLQDLGLTANPFDDTLAGTGTGIKLGSASTHENFFKLTSSELSFFLCCDSVEDKELWVCAIQQAIDDFKRLNAHVELYAM